MTGNTLVLIFLFVQVFVMGALTVIAVRYAMAHFRPEKNESPPAAPADDVMTPALRQRLVQSSQIKFESALRHSVDKLEQDLGVSADHINKLVMRLASEIVAGEMERYRQELNRLHSQANEELGGISQEVKSYQEELKAKIAAELEAEKQRLIKQIDTRLGDAVASFLVETLGHNVDLGSQSAYLVALLEEHKADFVKGVADESKASS